MSRSKKDVRVITEVKKALDAALSEGTISQNAYARINIPGLKTRSKGFSWDDYTGPPPEPEPEHEPEPELVDIPEPEIAVAEPEPEPETETEYRDAVVMDACVPEVAEEISYAARPAEETVETGPAAIAADQVEPSGHDEIEVGGRTVSVQKSGVEGKEEEKGFAFTICFRCGRVDVTQYGDGCLPKDVKGDCEVENGIVTTACGRCRDGDDRSDKSNTESFESEFRKLRVSAVLFEGSMVQNVAKAVLSQEVPFITEEGGVAYRDMEAMMAGLKREDKMMSVDVEKYKRGGRTGLVCGFLAGGLMRPCRGQRAEEEEWGLSSQKKKSLFIRRV